MENQWCLSNEKKKGFVDLKYGLLNFEFFVDFRYREDFFCLFSFNMLFYSLHYLETCAYNNSKNVQKICIAIWRDETYIKKKRLTNKINMNFK